jgi:transcriptional regulator with XRE-family HTH domain
MSAAKDSTIGARVRAGRERLGWRREDLAHHAGISMSAVAQVESGRRQNVRPATLSALAQALGVTIDYLVRGGPPGPPTLEHRALVYGTDEEFLSATVPFLRDGIERSEAVLVVTTPANTTLLAERLGPAANGVEFADAESWYSAPGSTLDRYHEFAIAKLEGGAPWVRAIGEPVWTGRSKSEVSTWTRYESLLNLAFASWPVSIICVYDKRSVEPAITRNVAVTHPQTIGPDGVSVNEAYANPGEFVLDAR